MEQLFIQIHEFLISSGISAELQVFFLAMLPVTELRAAIPIGITLLQLPSEGALIWGVAGNIVPTIAILIALNPICNFLMKHSTYCKHFFEKLFHATREKHSKNFERYGLLFLFTFVAIPIPGSGGWTGALIAFLFGINFWKATSAISLGILAAGILITLGVESITSLINGLL